MAFSKNSEALALAYAMTNCGEAPARLKQQRMFIHILKNVDENVVLSKAAPGWGSRSRLFK